MDDLFKEYCFDTYGNPLKRGDFVYDLSNTLYMIKEVYPSEIESASYCYCAYYNEILDGIDYNERSGKYLKKVDVISGDHKKDYDILFEEFKPLIRQNKITKLRKNIKKNN
jgi:hypothetical protein